MAIPTITITGKVLDPSGAGVSGGEIRILLSTSGVVRDAATTADQKVNGEQRIQIGADGAVSIVLVPNASITPAGTVYHVRFVLANGFSWTEDWSVAAAPGAQEIGDITVVSSTPLVAGVQLPAGTMPGIFTGSDRRKFIYIEGAAGFPDELFLIMKNGDNSFTPQSIVSGNPA